MKSLKKNKLKNKLKNSSKNRSKASLKTSASLKKGSSKRRSFFIDPTFKSRKEDHLSLSLDAETQKQGDRFIDKVQLRSTAFPEINFEDVDINTTFEGHLLSAPFFISSMTSGTSLGEPINEALALLSQEKRILMGVGSQRKE